MITDGFDFAAVPVLIAGSALGLALAGLMIKVIATAWIGDDQNRGQDDLDQQLDLLRAERQRLEDAGKRNAISAAECAAAMQDIDRRLLAIADRIDQKAGQKTSGRALIWGLAVLVPTTSIALYLFLGSPATPDRPYASRTAEIAAARSANAANTTAAATALRDAIKASEDKPDVVESWLRLAEAAAGVADAETEIRALRTAIKLTGDDPAIMAMLAEALSRAADGQITVPARELINKVLAADPDEPRALFMSGLARYQDGDYAAAVSIWQRLLAISTPDAPWIGIVQQNIARAAKDGDLALGTPPAPSGTAGPPAPDAADIAAAANMSPAERDAMINSMVARLEQRLADTPDDVEGWTRLARAYEVLGKPDAALEAVATAANLAPADLNLQFGVLEQLLTTGNTTARLDLAKAALANAEKSAPSHPQTLFFRGHLARLDGDTETARIAWQTLLDRMPPDSEMAKALAAEVDKLK